MTYICKEQIQLQLIHKYFNGSSQMTWHMFEQIPKINSIHLDPLKVKFEHKLFFDQTYSNLLKMSVWQEISKICFVLYSKNDTLKIYLYIYVKVFFYSD
jgi:hypothetical protein